MSATVTSCCRSRKALSDGLWGSTCHMASVAWAGVLLQAGSGGPVRVVLVGGAPLGRRHLWWNFVASRPELITQAADAWERDALGQVAGETERIPLPAVRWRGA